jgi:hypothetical protein
VLGVDVTDPVFQVLLSFFEFAFHRMNEEIRLGEDEVGCPIYRNEGGRRKKTRAPS